MAIMGSIWLSKTIASFRIFEDSGLERAEWHLLNDQKVILCMEWVVVDSTDKLEMREEILNALRL